MFSAIFLVALFVAVSTANPLNCCTKFTASQENFLRKLLQDEAKGLQAGMMQALSMPKPTPSGKWINLTTTPVCFGATGNSFGTFTIQAEGFLVAIKLVHKSGTVTCDKSTMAKNPSDFDSKWGCAPHHPYLGKTSINTLITTATDKIIFPRDEHFTHEHANNLWYNMEQFDSQSNVLVFQRFDDPLYVANGQQLRVWYGEDLKDVSEDDNGGQTCADVLALYI